MTSGRELEPRGGGVRRPSDSSRLRGAARSDLGLEVADPHQDVAPDCRTVPPGPADAGTSALARPQHDEAGQSHLQGDDVRDLQRTPACPSGVMTGFPVTRQGLMLVLITSTQPVRASPSCCHSRLTCVDLGSQSRTSGSWGCMRADCAPSPRTTSIGRRDASRVPGRRHVAAAAVLSARHPLAMGKPEAPPFGALAHLPGDHDQFRAGRPDATLVPIPVPLVATKACAGQACAQAGLISGGGVLEVVVAEVTSGRSTRVVSCPRSTDPWSVPTTRARHWSSVTRACETCPDRVTRSAQAAGIASGVPRLPRHQLVAFALARDRSISGSGSMSIP